MWYAQSDGGRLNRSITTKPKAQIKAAPMHSTKMIKAPFMTLAETRLSDGIARSAKDKQHHLPMYDAAKQYPATRVAAVCFGGNPV